MLRGYTDALCAQRLLVSVVLTSLIVWRTVVSLGGINIARCISQIDEETFVFVALARLSGENRIVLLLRVPIGVILLCTIFVVPAGSWERYFICV